MQRIGQERLHTVLHERHEDEESPHAVDDAGDCREQVERASEDARDCGRSDLHEKQSYEKRCRDGDQQSDDGCDQRSVDCACRAELHFRRIPFGGAEEAESEFPECRHGVPRQLNKERERQQNRESRRRDRRDTENPVGEGSPPRRFREKRTVFRFYGRLVHACLT